MLAKKIIVCHWQFVQKPHKMAILRRQCVGGDNVENWRDGDFGGFGDGNWADSGDSATIWRQLAAGGDNAVFADRFPFTRGPFLRRQESHSVVSPNLAGKGVAL